MATEGSTSSLFPVFIDTNLGTHLSLTINRDDTAAQLKGKIMSEHPRCFPQIGEISIEALKVKYGETYYHLADSMIVKFAFEHIKGARFLNIDLVPALCTINNHTEAIMRDNDVQPQNCIPLSINHNASLVPVSVPREHENTILPGAGEQTPSELETAQLKEQAISGAHVQQSFGNDANITNNNERVELEHKDAAVEPKKDAPLVSNKNEKYNKRNSSLFDDEIFSGKHYVGKRKHKKGKDVNLDSFHEAAAQFDLSMQDLSDATLKRKKKKVLSSNDKLPQNNSVDESLHMVDDAVKENQTIGNFAEVMVSNSKDMGKKSEMVVQANSVHSNILQVEYNKNERVELEHKNAAVELKKDAPLVSDKNEKYQKSSTALLDDDILSEKDHVGKRAHKKDEDANLGSFHEAAAQFDSSMLDPSDVKLKRKKNKVLSSNDELPQNNPADESLPKVDDAAKENETTEIFIEGMVSSSEDMGKESEIVVPKEANSLHSNAPQVEYNKNERLEVEHKNAAETKKDAPFVSNKNENYQKHNTSLHGDEILSKKDHVGKRKHTKDKDVNYDSFQEAAIQFDSSMQAPSNVRLKKKKKKVVSGNDELPQNVPADESLPKVDDAAKENETTKKFVDVMVSNSEDTGKESEIVVPKEASSLHSSIIQVESLRQAGVDAKRKRRKKVLEEPPQNKLINNSLDGIDASGQEKPIKHHVGEITNKNVKLGTNFEKSVTHGHDSSGKINATSKEIQSQEIQVQESHEEELILRNNSVDESLPKVDDAAKENRTAEIFEEVTLSKNKDLGRESEIVVLKEANSLHSNITQVESLGSAGIDAKRKRRKKVLEEPPQNKLINSSLGEVDASAQEKSISENRIDITNGNAKLGKNSEVTDTLGHGSSGKDKENPNKTTVANSSVDEFKITLSPADKKKRRTCKNKEKTEPLVQELQSSKHEVVGSSIDQATLNLPKAPSVNQPEKSNPGLNGEGVVEDISNEKKTKRSRKKSEKIEQQEATMPSDTQKIVNLTVDQVNEDSTKELSDNPTNVMEATIAEAAACEKKSKRSRKRNASLEHEHLTAADGHPVMDTAVQVKPSDQKSKRSKKKSEKANFRSKESSIIKGSAKENIKEMSTGEIGHTNENSEEVSRTVDKIVSAELDWANNQIEAQNHIAKKPVGADFVSDVCNNEKAAKVNQEEMIKDKTENTDENVETLSGIGDNKTTDVLNNADIKELPQADTDKIDFMDYFGRTAKQHEIVQEKISRKTKRERKLKTSPHDSTTTVKMLKHEHNLAEKKLQESDSSRQSLNGPALQTSKAQVDAPKKHESKDTNYIMASNNNSDVVTNNLKEGAMARLDASVGSIENGTQNQRITSRCAIKKVQNNSPKSKLSNYHGEVLTPGTIFDDDDANSGSSIDNFIISSRPNLGKTSSGNSSETDDDSDSDSDETSIYLGASDDNVFRSAFDNPTKLSRKNEPISTILKSTRSYQRAKLSASQPEFDDTGSQNVDAVFGTQPESPEI